MRTVPHTIETFSARAWVVLEEFPSKALAIARIRELRETERNRTMRHWYQKSYRLVPTGGNAMKPLPSTWLEQQSNDPKGVLHFWQMKVIYCKMCAVRHRSGTKVREQWNHWRALAEAKVTELQKMNA